MFRKIVRRHGEAEAQVEIAKIKEGSVRKGGAGVSRKSEISKWEAGVTNFMKNKGRGRLCGRR